MENKTQKLVLTALMAALCYIAFTFLKIPIPTAGGYTALHIGNAFCVLAALLIGGLYGGLAGSLGMTIADLMSPAYIHAAPKTFVLKLYIGLIAGFIAHKVAKINESSDKKYIFKWTLIASISGFAFNVIMDPIVGYFYNRYILGVEAHLSKIMTTWAAGATTINAIVGTVLVMALYPLLRPVFKKQGWL